MDVWVEYVRSPTPEYVFMARQVGTTRVLAKRWLHIMRQKPKDNLINYDPQSFLTAKDIQT